MNIRLSEQHIRFKISQSELEALILGAEQEVATQFQNASALKFVLLPSANKTQYQQDNTTIELQVSQDDLARLSQKGRSKEGLTFHFKNNLTVGLEVDVRNFKR